MKVLFISVHPDDETLGCGGTIFKHANQNDDLYWLILGYSKEFILQRTNQIKDIAQEYQFSKTYRLGFPTTKLHTIDFSVIIDKIFSVIQEIKPEIIYTVNRSDIHTDHQVAAKAIMSCTNSFRNPFIKSILMYECISETEIAFPLPENMFIAHVYSDISNFLERKIEIMKKYESELQAPPLPRSIDNIRALARFRGATVSVQYAEAFMLLREVF